MSWGGHVLYMIQMLRGNARHRPSLRRGYGQFQQRDGKGIHINYRKIKSLSDAERKALREKINKENARKRWLMILFIPISMALTAAVLWGVYYLALHHAPLNPLE